MVSKVSVHGQKNLLLLGLWKAEHHDGESMVEQAYLCQGSWETKRNENKVPKSPSVFASMT
jgi:hypothetical protein